VEWVAIGIGVATFLVALAGLIDQRLARRPLLHVLFSGQNPKHSQVFVRVEIQNAGETALQRVGAVALLDGVPLPETRVGPVTLGAHRNVYWDIGFKRPDVADVDLATGGGLTFHGKSAAVRVLVDDRPFAEVPYGKEVSTRGDVWARWRPIRSRPERAQDGDA
jgi:hypothetical protein